jgi:hypothetical protein
MKSFLKPKLEKILLTFFCFLILSVFSGIDPTFESGFINQNNKTFQRIPEPTGCELFRYQLVGFSLPVNKMQCGPNISTSYNFAIFLLIIFYLITCTINFISDKIKIRKKKFKKE